MASKLEPAIPSSDTGQRKNLFRQVSCTLYTRLFTSIQVLLNIINYWATPSYAPTRNTASHHIMRKAIEYGAPFGGLPRRRSSTKLRVTF